MKTEIVDCTLDTPHPLTDAQPSYTGCPRATAPKRVNASTAVQRPLLNRRRHPHELVSHAFDELQAHLTVNRGCEFRPHSVMMRHMQTPVTLFEDKPGA